MSTVQVRYIVNDVDAAIAFYCTQLSFREEMHPAPMFAMLSRGDLRLVLSAPGGGPGGGQAMPDGRERSISARWIVVRHADRRCALALADIFRRSRP
jgi:catechol 2,3-dioxygenase-like lactoylglutathione lyase family enzyme